MFFSLFWEFLLLRLVEAMEEPGQLKRAMIDTLAGAISGAISRTVTSPLDVIKIRFQVGHLDRKRSDFGLLFPCLIVRFEDQFS